MVRFSIAFADAEGALWQADGESGASRFWDQALDGGALYVQGEEPRPTAVARETERVIFADVCGYFDGRDRRYFGVHRPDAEAQDGQSTLLFEAREKYLGYRMSLVESRTGPPEGRIPVSHALILWIDVDVPAIARIHGYQKTLPTPVANLRLLSPLAALWFHPPVSLNELTRPLRRADRDAWLRAARSAGMSEDAIARVLRPNRWLTRQPRGR